MKKIILSLAVTAVSILGANAHNHDEVKINTKVSSVEWVGEKVTGKHEGTISIKEGSIHMHDGMIEKGKIVIDMTTITVTDMQGEWADKLKGHLESDDFFSVESHNTAVFEMTKATKKDGDNYEVTGNLTIKGITKPLTFMSKIEMKDGKLAAYAELKVDRTLYDIKYGSGKFFEGLGDKMISDEFLIKFKIAGE